jgi:2-keto-4-pentenoate hydratase/2-oxohepta-3-ene-1,7-dioic acid hydratase in catechol pathway
MRIARFKTTGNKTAWGIVQNDVVSEISGDIFSRWKKTDKSFPLAAVTLLAPLQPLNLIAIGRNYLEHAREGGAAAPAAPLIFLKATTAVTDPGAPIRLPKIAPTHVDYEAELAVIIGRSAKDVPEDKALEFVLGYTCANDVSARDCQNHDAQWARAKSFDTFAPLGPWIETEFDPRNRNIALRLNGRLMQSANTSQMIFSVPHLISYLSRCMTLAPKTVILTGTPAGCGFARTPPVWLRPGDEVAVEIEGLGNLRNKVEQAC